MSKKSALVRVTANIVVSFVSTNNLRATDLPDLIAAVYGSLAGAGASSAETTVPDLRPAVPIKKSVTDDYLICLEDGKHFKSLRRHLAMLGMTPNQYREKWGLPRNYPMVAPAYARNRSALAQAMGLGKNRAKAAVPLADSAPTKTAA